MSAAAKQAGGHRFAKLVLAVGLLCIAGGTPLCLTASRDSDAPRAQHIRWVYGSALFDIGLVLTSLSGALYLSRKWSQQEEPHFERRPVDLDALTNPPPELETGDE